MAKVAVLGHGVVGSGVVEVMEKNKAVIEKKAGAKHGSKTDTGLEGNSPVCLTATNSPRISRTS